MTYLKPLPVGASSLSRSFWQYCKAHELRVQRCSRCGHHWFPPQTICPDCWSREWEWQLVSGRGRIFSFVVYRHVYHPAFSDDLPYCVGVIELEEGARMLSAITSPVDAIRCDAPVHVDFADVTDDVSLPLFTLTAVT